jgi:clan AA aspartic protease
LEKDQIIFIVIFIFLEYIINIEGDKMGIVHAEITLKNVKDKMKAEVGYIKEPEIRQTTIQAVVDTGAMTLVINEQLRQQLGLEVVGAKVATLANNVKETVKIAETVEVRWKNRSMTCQPWVVGSGRILLGAIPLENMDLMVDPGSQELVGAHGEEEVGLLL